MHNLTGTSMYCIGELNNARDAVKKQIITIVILTQAIKLKVLNLQPIKMVVTC